MAAVVLGGHGDYDQYRYREDVRVPIPQHGEVLVEVEASSLNNTDVAMRTDWYEGKTDTKGQFPRIQGADAVGRIIEIGPNVEPGRVGERVLCDPRLRDEGQLSGRYPQRGRGLLGSSADGGFAQYLVVPDVNAWGVSETLPAGELACYPVAYSTALDMILRSRPLPAQTMVVTGASGGVGVALIQLAKLFQIHVVAIAGVEKAARLRQLGADLVVDRAAPNLAEAFRQKGIDSFDVVADVVGGDQLAELIGLVRPRGRCVTAGAIAGPISRVDLRHLIYREIKVIGVARTPAATFANLVNLINAGCIHAPVAASYPLAELVAAQQEFVEKRHVGKIVIAVSG